MTHLVHLHPKSDGSLPVTDWQRIEAENNEQALVECLKLDCNKGLLPQVAYVSDVHHLYENGSPSMVQKFTLSW